MATKTKAKARKPKGPRRLLKFNLCPNVARGLLVMGAPQDRDELLILLDALAVYDDHQGARSPRLAPIYAEKGKPLIGRLAATLGMLLSATTTATK